MAHVPGKPLFHLKRNRAVCASITMSFEDSKLIPTAPLFRLTFKVFSIRQSNVSRCFHEKIYTVLLLFPFQPVRDRVSHDSVRVTLSKTSRVGKFCKGDFKGRPCQLAGRPLGEFGSQSRWPPVITRKRSRSMVISNLSFTATDWC